MASEVLANEGVPIELGDSNNSEGVPDAMARPLGFLGDLPVTVSPNLVSTPTPTPVPSMQVGKASEPPMESLPNGLGSADDAPPTDIHTIVCAYPWPQGCAYWLSVSLCESSWRSDSVGYGGTYLGLFQIWIGHGYTNLLDPMANTLAAWELSYEGRYTGAWPYCQYQ